jgi:hypothetical protein
MNIESFLIFFYKKIGNIYQNLWPSDNESVVKEKRNQTRIRYRTGAIPVWPEVESLFLSFCKTVMTTIPTRLARAAAVSTSSGHQRKRVLDLYREWMRGVRFSITTAAFAVF